MLGQAMLGLAIAMYGPKQEEVIIVAKAMANQTKTIFTVQLNPDEPGKS